MNESSSPIYWYRPQKKKSKWAKLVLFSPLIVFFLTTAIFHTFGPYEGKVVDLKTGEPLSGAVILIIFSTEHIVFPSNRWFVDAVETVTDSNGEFHIPTQWLFTFHPNSYWGYDGDVTIFKPGYGVYPGHKDSISDLTPNGSSALPKKQFITFKISKLNTREDRKRNLTHLYTPSGVPGSKTKKLLKAESQERINVGLSPLPSSRWGE